MQTTTTRRALLASAPALVAAGAFPALAASPPADPLAELWPACCAAVAEANAARAAYRQTYDRLPWWARSGPAYLDASGEHVGHESGWPARQDVEPPRDGLRRRIRSGPGDIRRDFKAMMMFQHPAKRAEVRAHFRERMRAAIALRREQMAEWDRVGLPAAEEAVDVASDRRDAIMEEINALPPATPNVIAARILISFMINAPLDTGPDDVCEFAEIEVLRLLEDMRPMLTGPIAGSVAAVFADRERPIVESVAMSATVGMIPPR